MRDGHFDHPIRRGDDWSDREPNAVLMNTVEQRSKQDLARVQHV